VVEIDRVTGQIVDAGVWLHRLLGPGLLESVYQALLAQELEKRGLRVERNKKVGFECQGLRFHSGFRLDLLVEEQVVVELKSVRRLAPVHARQVLTYLRLMDLRVGLLMNFGGATLVEGLRRLVNNHQRPSASPSASASPRAIKRIEPQGRRERATH
jgi:GxxExxY protein